MHKVLHLRDDTLYRSRTEGERRLATIEVCINLTNSELEQWKINYYFQWKQYNFKYKQGKILRKNNGFKNNRMNTPRTNW